MTLIMPEGRAVQSRERARLRAERWRRAHGIMPRKPASKPWLAEGVSRATWYRAGNRIGDMTKGQKAMALAVHYPEPGKGGRGKTVNFLNSLGAKTGGSARVLLSQARTVLRDNPAASLDRADATLSRLSRELTAAAGHMVVAGSILREFPAV